MDQIFDFGHLIYAYFFNQHLKLLLYDQNFFIFELIMAKTHKCITTCEFSFFVDQYIFKHQFKRDFYLLTLAIVQTLATLSSFFNFCLLILGRNIDRDSRAWFGAGPGGCGGTAS